MSEALTIAEHSDIIVLCIGLDETLEGEQGDAGNSYASGDKNDLNLPVSQTALAEAVFSCHKPVIVLNMTGSTIDLRFAEKKADALMQIWYPGARGGKVIADLLFGTLSPSGKLPVTFYNDINDLPDFEDYSMKGRTYRYFTGTPLYPFGYGLTYGNITIESVTLSPAFEKKEHFDLTVRLVNKSDTATGDVIQVYVKAPESIYAPPGGKLCGFKRVFLQGWETLETTIQIEKDAFFVVNDDGVRISGGGKYVFSVGTGQPDARTAVLTGKRCIEFNVHKKG